MRTKVVLLIVLVIASTSSSSARAQVVYDRKSGRLSATYHGAPLREVLAEISGKTGIAVYIDPAVDKSVFIEKKDKPVDEVLNEIIAPLNSMLIYRGDTVTAVKIYEQSPADAMQMVAPRGRPEAKPRSERTGTISEERQKKSEERKAERERRRQEMMKERAMP